MSLALRLGFILILGGLAASASAQSVPAGVGTLTGSDRLKVGGCGKESEPISLEFSLAASGDWVISAGGEMFSGTSTTSRRLVSLTFSAGSLAGLDQELEEWASELCQEAVSVDSLMVSKARLKVSKRQTRAKLRLKLLGTGTAASGSGSGRFRVKASGPWQVAS